MKNFLERVWPGDSCRSDGCRDVVAVVASHCDPPTLAMLCRTAYCIRDVAQPHLYRRVFISSFSRAASFFAAMSKGPPSLAKMVLTYSESSNARMPHLVTPEFAKNVARSLYRMSDSLEALRLAHSVQALHELNESVVASLMRLRRLRIVDLHEYPTSARGLAAPNTSLTDLRLSGEDERGNSTSVPAPHFVRRLVYQSYEDLQVLRLTVCSMADVVEACKGITWQRVHTLGLDDCVIPEMFTVVFPGLVTLELWARRHEEKHVPVQGWQRLSMLECVVGCIGRHRASTPPNTHNGLRVVAKLAVRSTGPEPVSFDKVTSAISCVVREKLEQLRVGYIGDRGALPALFGLADGVYNLVLELRMREARDPSLLALLDRCVALQRLLLVFREQEAMAEFENRFLQRPHETPGQDPSKIPARTAYGTPFARLVAGRAAMGPRGEIRRPNLLRTIVLSLRSGFQEDEREDMRRTWKFDDILRFWVLME